MKAPRSKAAATWIAIALGAVTAAVWRKAAPGDDGGFERYAAPATGYDKAICRMMGFGWIITHQRFTIRIADPYTVGMVY